MRALDLNLASRPFRNNVPVWAAHILLASAVLGFAYWNVRTYGRAKDDVAAIQADIGSTTRQMADLDTRDAEAVRAAKQFDLKILQFQADQANDIILRRGLSWTQLFNDLEKVVPYEVKMTAIRPVYGTRDAKGKTFDGAVPISVEGVAQSLQAFLELERALIMDPHYGSVEPLRTESVAGQTELKFELTFIYDPGGRMRDDRPDLPHVLDAARKAAEEGGEAPPEALKMP
jgi:Tfp pilus assembly protein PilN